MLSGHFQGSSAASVPALASALHDDTENPEETEAYDCIIRAHKREDCSWRPTRRNKGFKNFNEVKYVAPCHPCHNLSVNAVPSFECRKHAVDYHGFECKFENCGEILNKQESYIHHLKAMECPGPSNSWRQYKESRREREHAVEYHRFECLVESCGEIFHSQELYINHLNDTKCPGPSDRSRQGKESRRKRKPVTFVTDIAATQNILNFLDIIPGGRTNKESWFAAYQKLFPSKKENLPSCSRFPFDQILKQSTDKDAY